MDHLILLGSGDALGVPRVYCDCEVCHEARSTGVNRRKRPSALLRTAAGDLLIDCTPDWRLQMEALAIRHVESVLISHGHHDHIGGIPDLGDSVRWTGRPLRLMGAQPALDEIQARYPWALRRMSLDPLSGPAEVAGWSVQTWSLNHGYNGRSFAFRFERPGFAWAYCPDAINLSEAEAAPLGGLDLLILGTAYYDEPAPVSNRSIYSMVEALELLDRLKPRRTVFTHLSHGVDRRVTYPLPPSVRVGYDGMRIDLAGCP